MIFCANIRPSLVTAAALLCFHVGAWAQSNGRPNERPPSDLPISRLRSRIVDLGAKDGLTLISEYEGRRRRAISISVESVVKVFKDYNKDAAELMVQRLSRKFDELQLAEQRGNSGINHLYIPSRKQNFIDANLQSAVLSLARFYGAHVIKMTDAESNEEKQVAGLRLVKSEYSEPSVLLLPSEVGEEDDPKRMLVALPHDVVGVYEQIYIGVTFSSHRSRTNSKWLGKPALDALFGPEPDRKAARNVGNTSDNYSLQESILKKLKAVDSTSPNITDIYWHGTVNLAGDESQTKVKEVKGSYQPFAAESAALAKTKVDDGGGKSHIRYLDGKQRPDPWQISLSFLTRGDDVFLKRRPAFLFTEKDGLRISSERFDEDSNISLRYLSYISPRGIFRNGSPTLGANFQTDQDGVNKRAVLALGYEVGLDRKALTRRSFRKFDELRSRPALSIALETGYQLSQFHSEKNAEWDRPLADLVGQIRFPKLILSSIGAGKLTASISMSLQGVARLGDRSTFNEREHLANTTDPDAGYGKRKVLEGGYKAQFLLPFTNSNALKITYSTFDKENANGTPALRRFRFEIVTKF